MRKLEYFEDELNASPTGREILGIVRAHMEEVNTLVNQHRAVMVAWQRNHGPRFLMSTMDSGFEATTPVPKEIDGITLQQLLLRMADALLQAGSPGLRDAIGRCAAPALNAAAECASVAELFVRIRRGTLTGPRV
jgi:hypothetical protein